MPFRFETELVETVIQSAGFWSEIKSDKYSSKYKIEVGGLFGIPDLVVIQKVSDNTTRSIAFEMKLQNWRRALIQAFRYRAFAERAIVVLDHSRINPAKKRIDQFIKSQVGLISVDSKGSVVVHYFPPKKSPFSKTMKNKLESQYGEFLPIGTI